MKTFKRNAVIITVLLFVCVAAYLNWSYSNNADSETAATSDDASSAQTGANAAADPSDAGLYYSADSQVNKEYFDTARLNREQARSAAAASLATVSKTDGASKEMIDASLKEISQIASDALKEAQLEDLIKAKGFSDCVVYISNDGVTVTVPAPTEGLTVSSVAKIRDIVTAQTTYKATDLKIIEVK
ncbi:SpoIIIAH-like family protein [Oscillospiraceae bacterium CM]|nr:SpoIIIAH-like family protein [Oscillospiraceae bacterium CM]